MRSEVPSLQAELKSVNVEKSCTSHRKVPEITLFLSLTPLEHLAWELNTPRGVKHGIRLALVI